MSQHDLHESALKASKSEALAKKGVGAGSFQMFLVGWRHAPSSLQYRAILLLYIYI